MLSADKPGSSRRSSTRFWSRAASCHAGRFSIRRLFGEGPFQQRFLPWFVVQFPGPLARCRRHLLPRLLQRVDDLVVGCFRGQVRELKLKEYKAESVFQDAAGRIFWEISLQIERLYFGHDFLRVTCLAQYLSSLVRMELFQVVAPFQVSGARHLVGTAWDHPPTDVLAAGSQPEFLRGVGAKFQNPVRQPLGVQQLARTAEAFDNFQFGIERILPVEAADGSLEPSRVAGSERRVRCDASPEWAIPL